MILDLAASAEVLGVSVASVRRMLREAPPDLPGSPVQVGRGSSRRHLRWDRESIAVWWAAYSAWRRGETHRPARRPAIRSTRTTTAGR